MKPLLAALILTMLPYSLFAQSDSWDNLRQLRPGEKIQVVDMKLKSVDGGFAAYSEEAISVRVGRDEVSVPRTQVFSVKKQERSHRGRNVLLGLAIGAAGGAVAGVVKGATYHEKGETGVFMLVYTPIGAGIGAVGGACVPSGEVTVYRARRKVE